MVGEKEARIVVAGELVDEDDVSTVGQVAGRLEVEDGVVRLSILVRVDVPLERRRRVGVGLALPRVHGEQQEEGRVVEAEAARNRDRLDARVARSIVGSSAPSSPAGSRELSPISE